MQIDENQINWEKLRAQKEVLLEIIWQMEEDITTAREVKGLSGIIHLIDYLQDTAVDTGCKTEQEVFGE